MPFSRLRFRLREKISGEANIKIVDLGTRKIYLQDHSTKSLYRCLDDQKNSLKLLSSRHAKQDRKHRGVEIKAKLEERKLRFDSETGK